MAWHCAGVIGFHARQLLSILLLAALVLVVTFGSVGAASAHSSDSDEGKGATETAPMLSFVDEEVAIFLRGDVVEEADIDELADLFGRPRGDFEHLLGRPKAVVSLSVKNVGDEVPFNSFDLLFEALTSLDEAISGPRNVITLWELNSGFPEHRVTNFKVDVLGVEAGWEGILFLQPCSSREAPATCEPAEAVAFQPATASFTVINRLEGFRPIALAFTTAAVFAALLLIGHVLLGKGQRGVLEPIRDWGDTWSMKNNVLAIFGFATAGLAALVGATATLDRLVGVDVGYYVGLNIFLAGVAGSSLLFARLFQVKTDDGLTPRVLFFWIGMAVAVLAALGILYTTGFLVGSMTFLSEQTAPLLFVALVVAGAAVFVFALQVSLYQSSRALRQIEHSECD